VTFGFVNGSQTRINLMMLQCFLLPIAKQFLFRISFEHNTLRFKNYECIFVCVCVTE